MTGNQDKAGRGGVFCFSSSRTGSSPASPIYQDLRALSSSRRGIEPAFGYPPVSKMMEGGGGGSTMSSITNPHFPISWT